MWKKALALLVAVVIIYGGVKLFQYRHQLFRPNFDRAGGTLLEFDLKEPADEETLDRAASVLTKRFDADGGAGVSVTHEGNRLVIAVPNGRQHDDIADRVRRLASRRGKVEFRVLANVEEDKDAIAEAEKQFRATTDELPAGPNDTEGGKTLVVGRGESKLRYRWFRLNEDEAMQLSGHRVAIPGAAAPPPVAAIAPAPPGGRNRKEILPCLFGGLTIYAYRPALGGASYFLLAREPGDGERAGSEGIERARLGGKSYHRLGGGTAYALQLTFDAPTAEALLLVSARNLSPRHSRGTDMKWLACIMDGEVFTTHMLDTPVRRKMDFNVWGTTTDAEDVVMLVQGGELPVKLKTPAAEKSVTPGGK